jgi:hypothetical protein
MDAVGFRLRIFVGLFAAVMVFGTLGFMWVEGLSLLEAFYFSIVTITTVGYGDFHPATPGGRVMAVLLIVMGVGTFLGVVANGTEMMLNRRERQARLKKLNMVIGVFFSEVGTGLLTYFSDYDPDLDEVRGDLFVTGNWNTEDFRQVKNRLAQYKFRVDPRRVRPQELKDFLESKTTVLLRLLENPNLLEQEAFAELLWAVFHLLEELRSREDLTTLPESDRAHLAGDMMRAYRLLVRQWLDYMQHLKENYPYLFSLSMRMNPFDRNASPVVK